MNQELIDVSLIEENRGQIDGVPSNPRNISNEKMDALKRSIQNLPDMLSMRELLVYPLDGKYVVLGGNMRYRACLSLGYTEVPCKVIPRDTPDEKLRAIVIQDNNPYGETDWDMIADEWDSEELKSWGLDLPEKWDAEAAETEGNDASGMKAEDDGFDADNECVEARCAPGDIWRLGGHVLMCGDSTSGDDVARLMEGTVADLVFTDPPYGMGKESEGVMNDNLNFELLLEFNKLWIPLSFKHLKDNGSWYCWGIDEPLMDIYSEILKPMKKDNKITFRNLITWDKGNAQGQRSDGLRMYARADEKCLFVMCGVQGFNTNTDNYFEGWEPVRSYLAGEAEKAGLNGRKLKEICGVGMYSHWFTKSQFEIIPEKHYKRLQERFNGKAFKREYEDIKREYYATRAYFDNTHDNMNCVWHFDRNTNAERENTGGHATPKPVELCGRAVMSSSREGETVLDLFGGSGSTLVACERLKRKCRMMELDPHYCDVIIARWEKLTGGKGERIHGEVQ